MVLPRKTLDAWMPKAWLLAGLACTAALQSCSGEAPVNQSSFSSSELSDLSGQLLEVLDDGAELFSAPAQPDLPADLSAHSGAQFESFSLETVLSLDDEASQALTTPVAALIAQIDRFALRPVSGPNEAEPDDNGSQWRFDGIMRSRVFVDSVSSENLPTGASDTTASGHRALGALRNVELSESVQRMALDLAGATPQSLWVGADRLDIRVAGTNTSPCYRSYRWEAALSPMQRIALDFTMESCPEASSLGELNTWAASAVEVSGALTSLDGEGEASVTALSGVAWFRQSWGNVPSGAGAVVIDTLTLALDDNSHLEVSRSKRRSGRGPKTVSATLHAQGKAPTSIELMWEDSAESLLAASGSAYPQSIALRSADDSLRVTATVMNRLSEANTGSDVRAHVPVVVTGTHTGVGFVSLTALPVDGSDQVGL